ncbi:MAG TPA: putative toxin-antitoxin system toxin component, PIN family [Blastocatellia bacterium]
MIKLVVDTNVIISANIKQRGAESRLLDLILDRRLQLYVSQPILAEYEGVLSRPKFRLDPRRVEDAIEAIRSTCTIVTPSKLLSVSNDDPDNRFLECAEEAVADFLVTGNKRHFRRAGSRPRLSTLENYWRFWPLS